MYTRFRTKLSEREEGFTLIELLVVIIIIGILAAIAIPVFLNQRQKAWQKAVTSDARNAVIPLEGYFSDNTTYAVSVGNQAAFQNELVVSAGDSLSVYGAATTYCIVAYGNSKGSFVTNSSGGVVELGDEASMAAAATAAAANAKGIALCDTAGSLVASK